jgi:uncharacterized membrane protein
MDRSRRELRRIAQSTVDAGNVRTISKTSWFVRSHATHRLGLALMLAVVAFIAQPDSVSWHTRLVASWDLGSLIYLGLTWALIALSDAEATRDHALSQDLSGFLIFLFVVSASCASIVAIGFVVGTIKDLPFWSRAWHLTLTVVALISSWVLIQTVFAFHYARSYYADENRSPSAARELSFPGNRDPDYLDFAYYAFVIGMTSQTSDVAVTSHRMRRLTLIQGVLAFIFNIAILALSINILASVI